MGMILRFLGAFASMSLLKVVLLRVLALLGIGFVAYTGVSALIGVAQDAIQAELNGLSADMLTLITIAKVPNAISVILSAITAKATLAGLTEAGVIRRITWGSNPLVLN